MVVTGSYRLRSSINKSYTCHRVFCIAELLDLILSFLPRPGDCYHMALMGRAFKDIAIKATWTHFKGDIGPLLALWAPDLSAYKYNEEKKAMEWRLLRSPRLDEWERMDTYMRYIVHAEELALPIVDGYTIGTLLGSRLRHNFPRDTPLFPRLKTLELSTPVQDYGQNRLLELMVGPRMTRLQASVGAPDNSILAENLFPTLMNVPSQSLTNLSFELPYGCDGPLLQLLQANQGLQNVKLYRGSQSLAILHYLAAMPLLKKVALVGWVFDKFQLPPDYTSLVEESWWQALEDFEADWSIAFRFTRPATLRLDHFKIMSYRRPVPRNHVEELCKTIVLVLNNCLESLQTIEVELGNGHAVESDQLHRPLLEMEQLRVLRLEGFLPPSATKLESFIPVWQRDLVFLGWKPTEGVAGNLKLSLRSLGALSTRCRNLVHLDVPVHVAHEPKVKGQKKISKIYYSSFTSREFTLRVASWSVSGFRHDDLARILLKMAPKPRRHFEQLVADHSEATSRKRTWMEAVEWYNLSRH